MARSSDLKRWTNVSDEPLIVPGPDSYDALMIAMNQVIRVDGRYVAVLHGTGSPRKPRDWCTTFAVSDDLVHWTKSSGNPVPPVATFNFGPLAASQTASTRIRLAKTQDVVAIAKMADGSFVQTSATVKVTIGGCGG